MFKYTAQPAATQTLPVITERRRAQKGERKLLKGQSIQQVPPLNRTGMRCVDKQEEGDITCYFKIILNDVIV